jgi:hypothetical protein
MSGNGLASRSSIPYRDNYFSGEKQAEREANRFIAEDLN